MLTVILSGGASRRMGRDKAMLPFGRTTMLQSIIDKYSVLGPVAVSVNEAGRFPFYGADELVDRWPDMGPLNGVITGLEAAAGESIFLTATDLPYGSPEAALQLAELMGEADACLLRRGKKGMEPLFAVYGPACLEAAKSCLARGEKSFFDMLKKVNVRFVEPWEMPGTELEDMLRNINTPEDYAAAEK